MNNDVSTNKTWSLVCIYLLSFTTSASVSVIAPFFPTEAAKKGMSASTAGYVFSVYGASLIVMNSIVGKVLPYIGNKAALAIGILVLGPANILFGLLENVDDYTYFSVFCFVIRVIEATGAAFVCTTSFMTIMKMFPENSAKQIAYDEAAVSAGFMFGPVVGSAMFAIGGYSMPFTILGTTILLNLPLSLFVIKSYIKSDCGPQMNYTKLISIFDVSFVCSILFTITVSLGALETTLGLYLESYNIGPSVSGLVFFVPSAAYCLSSAVVGNVYASSQSDKYYIIGLSLNAIGFLCIGPFSQIQSIRSVYFVVFSLFLIGVGCACVVIPTMPSALRAVQRRGFEDNITTCSIVSGLWTTVYSFGYVIGPTFGALTFENFGYPIFSLIIAAINVIVAILCGCLLNSSKEDETVHQKLCSSSTKCYESNSNCK